ncbi:MAG: hypothetical protein KDA31_03155 [Phycisphaerales bacterium]|nr:hypothetical protein [Phycisphaerales bacterium]MCB9837200.1 hypothetical protein [Phycisphaera sp.]
MSTDERIYVGYLPMSGRLRTFTLIAVSALLLAGLVASGIVAYTLRRSGTGQWDTSQPVTLSGVARLRPYPHLETLDGPVLLAEPGKHGAQGRTANIDGHEVMVTGTTLMRGTLRALEITEVSAPSGERVGPTSIELGADEITLLGEILDSKCYLGAMKPGDGPTHKACAILCLRGGIAPLFVGETEAGEVIVAVLCSPDGSPVSEEIIAFAGETVRVRGRIGTFGSLQVFAVAPGALPAAGD